MPGSVSDTTISLADKMRVLAYERDDIRAEFSNLADQLDNLNMSSTNLRNIISMATKARRRWCEETGEPM